MARQPLAKLLETLMERERESTIKSGYKSFNMFERSSFHLCSIIGGSEVMGGPKSSWISHYETEKRGSFGMMTLNGMMNHRCLAGCKVP